MGDIDYLTLFAGDSCCINDKIIVYQPKIRDIKEHGERDYFNTVYTLCSVGADMKWQLDDMGMDYTKVDDFQLFSLLCRSCPQPQTKLLLGDIDLANFKLVYDHQIQENVLLDIERNIRIDRSVYRRLVGVIRTMHGMKRNNELPGNEVTRQILIEDAREAYEEARGKEYQSILLPLVSTLTVYSNCDYERVFNLPVYTFTDALKRTSKIKNADLLLQSGYSGFGVDLKKINKDDLNYMGNL